MQAATVHFYHFRYGSADALPPRDRPPERPLRAGSWCDLVGHALPQVRRVTCPNYLTVIYESGLVEIIL